MATRLKSSVIWQGCLNLTHRSHGWKGSSTRLHFNCGNDSVSPAASRRIWASRGAFPVYNGGLQLICYCLRSATYLLLLALVACALLALWWTATPPICHRIQQCAVNVSSILDARGLSPVHSLTQLAPLVPFCSILLTIRILPRQLRFDFIPGQIDGLRVG